MKPRRRIILSRLVFFCSFPIFLSSCTGKGGGLNHLFTADFVDVDHFGEIISQNSMPIPDADTLLQQKLLHNLDLNVAYAYHLSANKPLWFDENGPRAGTDEFIKQLHELWVEGLHPSVYGADYLQQIWAKMKEDPKHSYSVDSIVCWDKAFTRAYLGAAKDLQMGLGRAQRSDSLWFAKNDSLFLGAHYLVQAMAENRVAPLLDTFRSKLKDYKQMQHAVLFWTSLKQDSTYLSLKQKIELGQEDSGLISGILNRELKDAELNGDIGQQIAIYQYYHQLKITGKNDTATFKSLKQLPDYYISMLQMNMDRLRSLPLQAGTEFVWANIPLMEVTYYRDNAVKFHSKIVVGKKSRQTPSLWARMANVVFNPPWGVPPTILKNDVGPGISRAGSGYLARKGLRAFNAKGQDVTASVTGENYRRFSYRQPPGAHNALGEVKFNLPNRWDIYLHDTPHRENFAARNRALSSGCVRVQNPKLLAEAILSDQLYTSGKIDSLIQTRRTKYEQIKRNLPVYIVYITVAADSTGSTLRYLDDVYNRDQKMTKNYTAVSATGPYFKN